MLGYLLPQINNEYLSAFLCNAVPLLLLVSILKMGLYYFRKFQTTVPPVDVVVNWEDCQCDSKLTWYLFFQ